MSYFRFLFRFLALAGLLVACVAGLICAAELSGLSVPILKAAFKGESGPVARNALWALVGGAATALVVVAFDLLVGVGSSAGRRSFLGFNVIIQVLLAITLLVGINIWSFRNYRRVDVTREREFTLPDDVAADLRKLRGETTIVVYLPHKTFGRFSDKPDRYDNAAEQKVVEKVQDLVQQLREFGPQFRVIVLDVNERDYAQQLAIQVAKFPNLAKAIDVAPENSIFFCSGNHVQRLGFNEFYQLDKTASAEANGGRGNLVLLHQGIVPFARRVLAIEEKRPRVALLASHPWLSSEGQVEGYSLAGLKKSLTDYGFEVRDILTNKLSGRRGRGLRLEKAVLSLDESRFDRVEAQLSAWRLKVLRDGAELAEGKAMFDLVASKMTDDELDRKLSEMYGRRVTMPTDVRSRLVKSLTQRIPELDRDLEKNKVKTQEFEHELETLQDQEAVAEGQRQTDLNKKLTTLLSDCDVLVIARMTLIDTSIGDVVPSALHQLDENQLAAVKEFMVAGKPVLFCTGPTNEPPGPEEERRPPQPIDGLEFLMNEVGFAFAPQAVLFDSEAEAYATNQVLSFGRGGGAETVPPLEFPQGEVSITARLDRPGTLKPNPLAASLRLVQRSAGQPIELRPRYPRPIYFRPLRGASDTAVSFLQTNKASWNEDNPYPTDDRPVPGYDAPKPEDATSGTLHERRRGPFPVGVAVETTLPVQWSNPSLGAAQTAQLALGGAGDFGPFPVGIASASFMPAESLVPDTIKNGSDYQSPKRVRIAVIGHGGWFSGFELKPAQETLAIQTLNWLLRRDDRLPQADRVWQYPRVEMTRPETIYWIGGVVLGPPILLAIYGFMVLMARKTR